ncbi:alpha/beta fold hydrolase [Rhizobacter sp. Root16D2]|uniref:alpha/beta fold hydrolase n=1 Tax=Rhizobacter sp. Root16D2 TaxID=1736479 RepID=UPI000AB70C6F|nr:alpha/beta hydrolase [Rhizobacter sp. Root16D2]
MIDDNGSRVFDHRRGVHTAVGGARIYSESLGPLDAPVLVLLHGGFGQIEDFNALLPQLGSSHRIIGIDSRGHGKSTLGDGGWTYQRVQEDVEAVLGALGVRRCSVLGFSDGGTVALRIGVAGKLLVERIVVVGSTWHRKNLQATRSILQGVTAESWCRKFPQTCDDYQRLNPEPDFERLAKALIPGWLDETITGHPDDGVAKIKAPVLIVRGDDDHLTSLADAVELRGKLAQAHFLNIPFAGHVAFADRADTFLPALREFLKSRTA